MELVLLVSHVLRAALWRVTLPSRAMGCVRLILMQRRGMHFRQMT
jgi:hypothetical protein